MIDLQSVFQIIPKAYVLDSFVVGPRNQWRHRDDILGIIVDYSFKRTELPLARLFVSDYVGRSFPAI